MNNKGPVRVIVRKTALVPGAKNVDLNSLRKIIEKTQQKLASTPKSVKSENVASTPQIKPDPEANNDEREGFDNRAPNKRPTSPSKVSVKVESDEQRSFSEDNESNDVLESSEDHSAKRQKLSVLEKSEAKNDYSCCFCKYTTKDADNYRLHIASHLKNKVLNCNICFFSTDKISVYNNHVRGAHSHKRTHSMMYSCPMCNFKDTKMEGLRRHQMFTGHGEKQPVQKCTICGFTIQNVVRMLEHIASHKEEELIKECKYCDEGEKSGQEEHSKVCFEVSAPVLHKYEETLESIEETKTLTCPLCDFQCKEPLFLVEHIKAHAKFWRTDSKDVDSPFSCTMCDFRCEKPNRLVLHMKTHKSGAIYRCKTCSFDSPDFEMFRAHRKLHGPVEGKNAHMCYICFIKFSDEGTLRAHMKSHIAPRPFCCHLCEYKCVSKTALVKHLRTHKQKTTTVFFPCPLCPQKYSTSASLRNHLSNHSTDTKTYQCQYCDYSCFTSELLRVHVQKHSGTNRFRCEICLVSYSSEAKLKAHIRDHLTTDKPLKCHVCHTSFSSRALLNRHLPIHSGRADPFVCYVCPRSFPTLKSRRVHMLDDHDIENEEEWKASQPIVVRPAIKSESPLDQYGYVEEDVANESDSEEELLHLG